MPGHREGHLLKGARNGWAVGTLVERTTRLVILAKMTARDARSDREGFTKKLQHVPASLRNTMPYDRGKERVDHARLAQRPAIQIFLADPYSPWQRGTNKHKNGLVPQSMPQGPGLSVFTPRALNALAYRLNTCSGMPSTVPRPRQSLRTCPIIRPWRLELETTPAYP